MITRNDNRLNCCVSVLLRVDEKYTLPDFDRNVLRIASAFGGGVGGWGSVCGAAAGVSMSLGLLYGYEGDEDPDSFEKKKDWLRDINQRFMRRFEKEFGSVNCMDLLGVDRRTEEGKELYEKLKAQGAFSCDKYVKWSAEKLLEILSNV
jgi:C_GCAxxG_C_C family probable redox protein